MNRVFGRVKYSLGVAVLVVSLIASGVSPAVTLASGEAFTGGSAVNGVHGTPIPISDLQISGSGNDTLPVRLYVSNGSLQMTTTTGLTFEGSDTGSTLYFSGSRSNVNAALATLEYSSYGVGEDTLEASLTATGEIYNPLNGHIYEIVRDETDGGTDVDWNTANTLAQARVKYDLNGYLTTMTSEEENDFVAERLTDAGWMGASDAAVEGEWEWVSGPETGMNFWSGDDETGAPVGDEFANWGGGEPNNAGNEDCAQFLSGDTGEWNDLPCDGNYLPYFVVEYGSEGELPNVATDTVAITAAALSLSIDTCEELQELDDSEGGWGANITLTADIDCEGATVEPLFDGEGQFYGVFDGDGHTIRNFEINESEECSVGLIARAGNATIRDLNLENGTVLASCEVGALLGFAENTTIENVTSDLDVTAEDGQAGGLVGEFEGDEGEAVVRGSSSTGTVTGGYDTGGLIGFAEANDDSTVLIEQSFATGNVINNDEEEGDDTGGLIGEVEAEGWDNPTNVTIQDVYAWGDVIAPNSYAVGGLIGWVDPEIDGEGAQPTIDIRRAYANGDVTGSYRVGGLLGAVEYLEYSVQNVTLEDTFATGLVTAYDTDEQGGLLGAHEFDNAEDQVQSSNNYFDQNGTGQEACSGLNALADCTAVNTDGQDEDFFINNNANQPMSSWDFEEIWVTNANIMPTFGVAPEEDTEDADGVSGVTEDAAPNDGDGNDDGTPDSEQPNVSSFESPVNAKYVTLELDEACSNTSVSANTEASKATADSGFDYPVGLVAFTSECGTNGYTATITQYYYGVSNSNFVLRKYNPSTGAYFMVPTATITAVTVDGQPALKVTYDIVDGGILDLDGVANGTIVDPVGLAAAAVGVPNTGIGRREN